MVKGCLSRQLQRKTHVQGSYSNCYADQGALLDPGGRDERPLLV